MTALYEKLNFSSRLEFLEQNMNYNSASLRFEESVLPQLERLDRYEQLVFTRRRRAIRKFCKTEPMGGGAIEPAAAVRVLQGAARDFCKSKPMPEVVPTFAPEAGERGTQDFCKSKPIPGAQSSAPVSVIVPGENVRDKFCRTNPTDRLSVDHLGVNPTTPKDAVPSPPQAHCPKAPSRLDFSHRRRPIDKSAARERGPHATSG